MTDAYYWRKDRPISVDPEQHGEVGSWQRLFGLTEHEWRTELRRNRKRPQMTDVERARGILELCGWPADEQEVESFARRLVEKAEAAAAKVEPDATDFGPRHSLAFRDWSGFSLAEIIAKLAEHQLTKNELIDIALMTGRFATADIARELRCSDGAISNRRTRLRREYAAGRISALPQAVTDSRRLSHVGAVRNDLRRAKKIPPAGKIGRPYGARAAEKKKDREVNE